MPGGNVFVWVLVAFPLYLMLKGRLTNYLNLATTSGAAFANATGTGANAGATSTAATTAAANGSTTTIASGLLAALLAQSNSTGGASPSTIAAAADGTTTTSSAQISQLTGASS